MRWLLLLVLVAGCDKAEKAKEKVEQAKEVAKSIEHKVVDTAKAAYVVKSEIDKVYHHSTDYDVVVSAEEADDAEMKAMEAKIAEMPHVTVGGVTIGYEEDSDRSLKGTSFSRHFRATWVHGGKKYAVGYYTQESLDAKAFAAMLDHIAPAVEKAAGL